MTITLTKPKLAIAVLAVVMLVPATAVALHTTGHANFFDDVPDEKFYADAATWAKTNDITTGSPAGSKTFKPEDPVTRGESVTFLKRYNDNVVQPAIDAIGEGTASITAETTIFELTEATPVDPENYYEAVCPAERPIAVGGHWYFPDEGSNWNDQPAWSKASLGFQLSGSPTRFVVNGAIDAGVTRRIAGVALCSPLSILDPD